MSEKWKAMTLNDMVAKYVDEVKGLAIGKYKGRESEFLYTAARMKMDDFKRESGQRPYLGENPHVQVHLAPYFSVRAALSLQKEASKEWSK